MNMVVLLQGRTQGAEKRSFPVPGQVSTAVM